MGAIIALVIASALLLSERTAPHGRTLESFFEDDQLLVNQKLDKTGNATVAATLETLKSLGVDRIRVLVVWRQVAPDNTASAAPAGIDAADPSDYGTAWSPYDRIDEAAAADGIKVDFDLTAPAPDWAITSQPAGTESPARADADVYEPSAADFEQFVHAAGRRYTGGFVPPGSRRALPRVSFWSAWNEPNQPGWLAPQLNSQTGAATAPALYRALVAAFWQGLSATGHSPGTDTILVGELAPSGCVTAGPCAFTSLGTAYRPVSPLPFLEDLYCVGPRSGASATDLAPLRGAAATAVGCPSSGSRSTFVADNPALFDTSGLSEHPYSFFLPPNVASQAPDDTGFAPLASLPRLEATLDAALAADGEDRRLPLYLTEYGYVTNPPNPHYTVTPAQQALYLDQAEYLAAQDPRVRALSQFELQDAMPNTAVPPSNPQYWDTFQEGLEYLGGAPKPALSAYRLPIFLPSLESPTHDAAPHTPVEVWGMLRPAANNTTQTARIQWRAAAGTAYRTLATTTTRDPSGIVNQDVVLPSTGRVRLAWTAPSGAVIYSRTVTVTVR